MVPEQNLYLLSYQALTNTWLCYEYDVEIWIQSHTFLTSPYSTLKSRGYQKVESKIYEAVWRGQVFAVVSPAFEVGSQKFTSTSPSGFLSFLKLLQFFPTLTPLLILNGVPSGATKSASINSFIFLAHSSTSLSGASAI